MSKKNLDDFSIKEIYKDDLIKVKNLIDEVSYYAYKSLIPKDGYEYLRNNL